MLASGGVLFLDEVREMSLSAQAKLLWALQEREFQHLGGLHDFSGRISSRPRSKDVEVWCHEPA